MAAAKKIKFLLIERDMTYKDLAKQLNITPSTFSDKMKRDNFREEDLQKIAEVLDFEYDIVFTDKKSGKTI